MCGLSGFVDFTRKSNIEILNKMVSILGHRGPDDSGSEIYHSEFADIGFGHNRLSIIDLSPAGHQPMDYEQYSILLNGEIYNYLEIKQELIGLGHNFVSKTDTEVVLHAFAAWGSSCVNKFIGMFVFVILNKQTNEITIIRDRAGVKPLFYYWNEGLFLFSSELKAFHQHSGFEKKINVNSVYQYMDFGYIPSPYCIFENCHKLEPGHILTFSIIKETYEITKYWDVNDYYRLPKLPISYDEAKEEVEKLLLSAFEYRMVSDVPVGVFLSGGYDSTAIAALLQSKRTEKLKTFTIGFEQGTNEAPYAKEIANYIGTDHTEYYCTTKEAQEIIPTLPFFYDEPFADSSAIPTILVSKLARESVTVALSGDAGDEIFAGYTYYKSFKRNLSLISMIPAPFRKILSHFTDIIFNIEPNINSKFKNKIEVLSKALKADPKHLAQDLQHSFFTLNQNIKNNLFVSDYTMQNTVFNNDFTNFTDGLSIALASDYGMYLQNDILTKVDRATMSVSLEGREPFLDHRIIEFVAQLPIEYKFGTTQKMILKDIVHKYVPKHIMDRPKMGFEIPIYSWLKKDLAYLVEENLNPTIIAKTGLFQPNYVQKIRQDFDNGRLKDPTIIWKLLQFQMWHTKWM